MKTERKIHKQVRYYSDDGFEFMAEPLEDTLTIKRTRTGYEARYLVPDEIGESPDEWHDDNLFLVHYHRDFDVRRDRIITEDDARRLYQGEKIEQDKEYWIFPVAAYIHSGVRLYLGQPSNPSGVGYGHFDTSHVGLVLASKKEYKTKAQAEKAAEGLIQEWNMYLSGDVYECVLEVYDKNKQRVDYQFVGSFYGADNALKELALLEVE